MSPGGCGRPLRPDSCIKTKRARKSPQLRLRGKDVLDVLQPALVCLWRHDAPAHGRVIGGAGREQWDVHGPLVRAADAALLALPLTADVKDVEGSNGLPSVEWG